jgi:hypothetical protein
VFILAHLRGEGLERHISGLFDTFGRQEQGGSTAGCSGSGRSGELADTNGAGSRQDWESSQPRPVSLEQSSCAEGRSDAGEVRERQAWPSRPGQPQHAWEPPRVVGNARGNGWRQDQQGRETEGRVAADGASESMGNASGQGLEGQRDNPASEHRGDAGIQFGSTDGHNSNTGEIEQSLGGDTYGTSDRLDYAKLCVTCDNRTDELRLLGNGVVPATAELAFRTLWNEL